MSNKIEMKLRENVTIEPESLARIACALKSLHAFASQACPDNEPEELNRQVEEALEEVDKLFQPTT